MDDKLAHSTDAEAVPKSMPILPTELIQHVLQLAFPPVRLATFPERYKLLRTFALISKRWTPWAQAELRRHAYADTRKACHALERAVDMPGPVSVARRAQSLRLSCVESPWSPTDLRRLLGKLQDCEEVWLWLRSADNETINLVLVADTLKRLYLDVAFLRAIPGVPAFSSLVELFITEPFHTDDTLAFLTENEFPALRSLGVASWYDLDAAEHTHVIDAILGRLGPRLNRFLFTITEDRSFEVLDIDWKHFTSLRSLALETPNDGQFLEVLRLLPSKLEALRLLRSPDGGTPGIAELVRERPASISALKTLTVPWCPKDEKLEIERLCAERGTAMEQREVALDWWEAWEDLVLYR